MCDSRKYPYPPHGWSMEIPKGWGGGLKGRNFLGVWGVPTRIFHSIVKDAIDRTRQT